MTQDRGSFRVARAVFDHPALAGEPYDKRLAWLSLIADAAWSERTVVRDRQIVKLERGQLAASHRFLGERWGWEHKRVARFLELLTMLDMIRRHNVGTIGIITITNYELYQASETPGHPRGTRAQEIGAPNGAPENFKTTDTAGISVIEHSDGGAPNGALTPHALSENRGKTNKQIKESKNPSPLRVADREIASAFEEWWQHYPTGRKVEKKAAKKIYEQILKRGETTAPELLAGLKAYVEAIAKACTEARFIKHPKTWLNAGCWADERASSGAPAANTAKLDAFWREKVPKFKNDGAWNTGAFGPRPGEHGCRVPAHILAEFNIRPPP